MPYSNPLGKTSLQLEQELLAVYNSYPEYNEHITFSAMVKKFADSSFYKLHLVAKEYIKLSKLN